MTSDYTILIDQFIRYMQTEKRSSEHTLRAYKNDIQDFFESVDEQNIDINGITTPIIRKWVAGMINNGLTPRTVNRKTAALNSFFRYLLRKKAVDHNPVAGITKPKVSKKLPVFITEEKLACIIDLSKNNNDYVSVRDATILETFYATGIRVSELVNLKHSSIDFSLGHIKVLGKRNKERLIPMTNHLKTVLREYLAYKVNYFPDNDNTCLFLTSKGKKVSIKLVYLSVRNHLKLGGLTGKCSPHILRHTFATHMLNNGADLNSVKEVLGHASLAATQVYTHNTFEKLKNIHNKAHPRA